MVDGRILELVGVRKWDGGRLQSMTVRLVLGSSSLLTWFRCFIARSKASRTVFLMEEARASISFILSSDLLIPKGAILDLGSHCLRKEEAIFEKVQEYLTESWFLK